MNRSTQLSGLVAAAVLAVGAPAFMSTAAAADPSWDGTASVSHRANVPYNTDEARAAFRAPDAPVPESAPAGLIESTDEARAAAEAQDTMMPMAHAVTPSGPIQNTDDARARRMNAG